MSEPLSSPERPLVKITYMDRIKRKRKIADVADDPKESSSSAITTQTTSTSVELFGNAMKPPSKAPVSKGPKKIDFHLPGPVPKRVRHDSEDTDATKPSHPEQPKGPSHKRSTSSISSLARVVQKVAESSPVSAKPLSVKAAKPPSSRRTTTPETEMDDNASIADSVLSIGVGKIRRTETQRIEYFRNQVECGTLEPHRALCTRCDKFVNLGRKQTYAVRPWETHRSRCDQQVLSSHRKGSDAHLQGEQSDEEGDNAPVAHPSASQRAPRKTVAERKGILEGDTRLAIVKSDEVKCRKCEKWIRLSNSMEYALGNWNKHALICCDAVPSSRVVTATRKLQLVNDPQAKSFGVFTVHCASCDQNVELGQEIDYDLTKWEEHKVQCHYVAKLSSNSPDAKPGVPSTEPSPPSVQPPRSSASTEVTLINSEPSPPAPSAKRVRDEPDLPSDDPDARPSNRPRSETYAPPQKEPPGAMGWFLLPFKAFVQGFRESLRSS